MRQIVIFFLKPLSFLPALAIMYVIYGFSAQDAERSGTLSYHVSYKVVEAGNILLDRGFDEPQMARYAKEIEFPVRKAAHMTEYFLLAVTVSFPLYVYGMRGFSPTILVGIFCVAFAAGDEYHQSFVAGRGPSVRDVMIDSVGAFFGILAVRLVCWMSLAPVRSARRQKEFAYRKHARRQEAMRRKRTPKELYKNN